MSDTNSFDEVLGRLKQGDEQAAAEIFTRYTSRLIGLARNRLNNQLRQKEDPEDVVQSVLRTFFIRYADDQFELDGWDSLWSLLASIALRKCGRRVQRFGTAGRDLGREIRMAASDSESRATWEAISEGPSPEQAAMLNETLDQLLRGLDERKRKAVLLRLQGFTIEEISDQIGRSERSVHRTLARVKDLLRQVEASSG